MGSGTDLPELHADGRVQLEEAGVQVQLLALGVVQVDGRRLVLVLLDQVQVVPQLKMSIENRTASSNRIYT